MNSETIEVTPDHPGFILQEEFLSPLGISQNQLATAAGVPRSRVNQIVKGNRAITAETSIRLGRALGMSDFFFLKLQFNHDRLKALHEAGEEINAIKPLVKPAA